MVIPGPDRHFSFSHFQKSYSHIRVDNVDNLTLNFRYNHGKVDTKCLDKIFIANIAFQNSICYNANRLKDISSPSWAANENPGERPPGFSIPTFGNGKA